MWVVSSDLIRNSQPGGTESVGTTIRRCAEGGLTGSSQQLTEAARGRAGKHKHQGMVNVTSRHCAAEGCMRQPNFHHPGNARGLYCCSHKEPGMVNVVSKPCAHPGCTKQPSFNLPGHTQARAGLAQHSRTWSCLASLAIAGSCPCPVETASALNVGISGIWLLHISPKGVCRTASNAHPLLLNAGRPCSSAWATTLCKRPPV